MASNFNGNFIGDGSGVTNVNAQTLDGIDGSRVVFGDNGSGSQSAPATENVYDTSMYKSGHWDVYGASWTPTTEWYWGMTTAHISNSSAYNYSGQLIFRNGGGAGGIYARTISGGNPSAWGKLWSSVNDGSGSGLDADLLDGIQSTSFLRSDAADTASGTITFTNAIMANGAVQVPYVAGTKKPMIVLQNATNYGLFHTEGTNDDFTFDFAGVAKFTFNQTGSLTAAGDVTAYSDARLKSDVVTIPNALDTVAKLRGVNYIKDGKASTGVIAQEVEEVMPEVVHTADDEMGTKSVAYGNMMGLMIEAIKELKAENEMLKARLDALESK